MGELASASQLRMSYVRWALVVVPLVLLLGILSGLLSDSGYGNAWFDSLVKPSFMPPAWAFPVAWTLLYILIGFAFALILAARGAGGRNVAVTLFIIQFILNLSWSPVFFKYHLVVPALIIVIAMFAIAAVATVRFARIRSSAALLMIPYLCWLVFAAALNFEIHRLNPGASELVVGSGGTQIDF